MRLSLRLPERERHNSGYRLKAMRIGMSRLLYSSADPVRPEGPLFNSHVRKGVVEKRLNSHRGLKGRRFCAGMKQLAHAAPLALIGFCSFLSTPSRARLLNNGPAGLRRRWRELIDGSQQVAVAGFH